MTTPECPGCVSTGESLFHIEMDEMDLPLQPCWKVSVAVVKEYLPRQHDWKDDAVLVGGGLPLEHDFDVNVADYKCLPQQPFWSVDVAAVEKDPPTPHTGPARNSPGPKHHTKSLLCSR